MIKTITTHFKRHGSGNWLELSITDEKYNYYIEMNDYNNNITINVKEFYSIKKVYHNKEYISTNHFKIILSKNYTNFNYQDIENDINAVLPDVQIKLEHFIESYHIPQREHPDDRDFINNIDITGFTTEEVITKCNINLYEYFKSWNIDVIKEYLQKPTKTMLKMTFKELYALIHWNSHKQDLQNIFINGIGA
jgi:hypothetical protein